MSAAPDLAEMHPPPPRRPWVWFYWGPFTSFRWNVLPWLGNDGNVHTWTPTDTDVWRRAYCRRTIVVPFLGAGAMIIALPWHPQIQCTPELFEENN